MQFKRVPPCNQLQQLSHRLFSFVHHQELLLQPSLITFCASEIKPVRSTELSQYAFNFSVKFSHEATTEEHKQQNRFMISCLSTKVHTDVRRSCESFDRQNPDDYMDKRSTKNIYYYYVSEALNYVFVLYTGKYHVWILMECSRE
uniref:Uncharacterized protein n=1 Tax=Glossina brevipalpis TaxID=37001 RepID=A0A1A9W8K2_9MUSC